MQLKPCPYCGNQHSSDSQFCPETGQQIELIGAPCPSCGERLPEEARFCPNCGQVYSKPAQKSISQREDWRIAPHQEATTLADGRQEKEEKNNQESGEKNKDNTIETNKKTTAWQMIWIILSAFLVFGMATGAGYWWTAREAVPRLAGSLPAATLISLSGTSAPTITPLATVAPLTTIIPATSQSQTQESPDLPPSAIETFESTPYLSTSRVAMFSDGAKEDERILKTIDIDSGIISTLATFQGGINFTAPESGGARVVFSSRTGTKTDDWDMFLLDLQTGESRLLSKHGVFPDWCRVQEKPWVLYEQRDGFSSTIWLFNLETQQSRQITSGGKEYRPKWNPECTQFVFSSIADSQLGDLFIYDLNSNSIMSLVRSESDEAVPVWSPDGSWIFFSRRSLDTNNDQVINASDISKIYLIHPDGSGEHELTGIMVSPFSPSWSPDSQQILFSAQNPNGGMQIMLYSLNENQSFPLTEPDNYYHPRWVP